MKSVPFASLILAMLLLLGCILGGILVDTNYSAQAQSLQQSHDLSWHTIDGGGHTWSSGGTYSLGGTIGQPDAGYLAGGTYALAGGFWEGWAEALHKVYLPLAMQSYAP